MENYLLSFLDGINFQEFLWQLMKFIQFQFVTVHLRRHVDARASERSSS